MKKINKIFLSIILLSSLSSAFISCGKSSSEEIPHYTEQSIMPFIDEFKGDAKNAGVDIGDFNTITVFKIDEDLTKTGNDDQSACIYHYDDKHAKILYKEIKFRPEILEYQEYLLYKIFLHEIGHCAYHLSDELDFNSSLEIMSPNVLEMSYDDFNKIKNNFFTTAKNNEPNWYSIDNF